jgi:urea carboxylase
MFGITPIPLYDPNQKVKHLKDFMCLFRPGDIVKFTPIDRKEYDETVAAVDKGKYNLKIKDVTFDLAAFNKDMDGTNAKLMGALNGR